MSLNLKKIVCMSYQKRYRVEEMRATLEHTRIWVWTPWTTLVCTARSRTLAGSKHPLWQGVVMCMLLLTPLKLNHLVNMIRYNDHTPYSSFVITRSCMHFVDDHTFTCSGILCRQIRCVGLLTGHQGTWDVVYEEPSYWWKLYCSYTWRCAWKLQVRWYICCILLMIIPLHAVGYCAGKLDA